MDTMSEQSTVLKDSPTSITEPKQLKPNPSSGELYFLVKDRQSAEKLAQSLEEDRRVKVETIKAFTDIEHESEPIKGANRPTVQDRTDIKNAARRGALIGVILGLLTALVLNNLPTLEPHVSTGMIAGVTMMGLILGIWFSTLIGISEPNPRLKAVLNEFKKGRVLVLIKTKPKFFGYIRSVSRHLLGSRIISQGKL